MKEKMLQVKEYVIAHKKQIIIGTGVAILAIVGGKIVISKLKNKNEEIVEIATGSIEEVVENKED